MRIDVTTSPGESVTATYNGQAWPTPAGGGGGTPPGPNPNPPDPVPIPIPPSGDFLIIDMPWPTDVNGVGGQYKPPDNPIPGISSALQNQIRGALMNFGQDGKKLRLRWFVDSNLPPFNANNGGKFSVAEVAIPHGLPNPNWAAFVDGVQKAHGENAGSNVYLSWSIDNEAAGKTFNALRGKWFWIDLDPNGSPAAIAVDFQTPNAYAG